MPAAQQSMLPLRSLGLQTDLDLAGFAGEIADRGTHVRICTPDNPSYHWGNFLVFPDAPTTGDLERWVDTFEHEFDPRIYTHRAFAWDVVDGAQGEIEPFQQAGYEVETCIVLVARPDEIVIPPKYAADADVAPVPVDDDAAWDKLADLWMACRDDIFPLAGYREFVDRRLAGLRAMAAAGIGCWFAVWVDGLPVADLGVFARGTRARYQSVATHPEHRRRGYCGRLVHHAAQYATAPASEGGLGAESLVMLADDAYHAARIYESVGFRPAERFACAAWWPRDRL